MKVPVAQVAVGAPLAHPTIGPIEAPFSMWPFDQFTCSLLREGSIRRLTDDEVAAAKEPAPPAGAKKAAKSAAAPTESAEKD